MEGIEFSIHATDMLRERKIASEWVSQAVDFPEKTELADDGNTHYIKAIPEHEGRFLRVVVNERVTPRRIVTLFFDRRLGRRR